jgi:hypothetical protein
MAAQKEIKKIPKDKLAKFKYLTNWLLNPQKPIDFLIEDKNEFNTSLKYRIFNYFINKPKIVWYLNTYLNGIYDFNNYDPELLLKTFAQLVRCNGIRSTNELYFTKFQNLKRNQFTNLLNNYTALSNDADYNQSEINNLFLLFEHNILTPEYIENIQSILSGKESDTNKKDNIKLPTIELPKEQAIKSAPIIKLCSDVNTFINNKLLCKQCPSYRKTNLIIETNAQELQAVDVAVICDVFPSKEDLKNQTFLSEGEQLQFKNYLISLFNKHNLTYTFTNKVLCYNTLDDSNINKKIISNCSSNISLLHQAFPSKLKVVLGAKVAKELGIKTPSKQLGNLINNEWFIISHPNDFIGNQKKTEAAVEQINKLNDLLSKQSFTKIESSINLENTSKSQLTSFTLFDIQFIENKVIYIVLDKDNNKNVIVSDFNIPIYLKYGNFKECDFITDNVNFVCYLNKHEKLNLQQKLLQNLKQEILKQNSISEDDLDLNYGNIEDNNESFAEELY